MFSSSNFIPCYITYARINTYAPWCVPISEYSSETLLVLHAQRCPQFCTQHLWKNTRLLDIRVIMFYYQRDLLGDLIFVWLLYADTAYPIPQQWSTLIFPQDACIQLDFQWCSIFAAHYLHLFLQDLLLIC